MNIRRTARWAIGCIVLTCGCGGLTVSPNGPTTVKDTVKSGHPTLLNFQGTLADGGSFTGYMIYGSRDVEGRVNFGRFAAIYWDVDVKGGSQTRDSHFTHTNVGRALLECYMVPEPTIGLVILWPDHDPELQWFTPHFRAKADFDPDKPPTLDNLGDLLPGSQVEGVSIYRDGQGGATLVTSMKIAAFTDWPEDRPPS